MHTKIVIPTRNVISHASTLDLHASNLSVLLFQSAGKPTRLFTIPASSCESHLGLLFFLHKVDDQVILKTLPIGKIFLSTPFSFFVCFS